MLTWSFGTLSLSLTVIMAICAAYLMIQVFQFAGGRWGVLFVVTPLLYAGMAHFIGPFFAGALIAAVQVYAVRPYWQHIGRVVVYEIVCWAGVLGVLTHTDGWRAAFLWPQGTVAPVEVVQASSDVKAATLFANTTRGRVWYTRSGAGSKTPLILVHDVPGGSSAYLTSLDALGDERPVVRYDQFGGGHSVGVVDTTAFTIAASVAELDSLRTALGFDTVHLLGHGTGAAIALEYARAHPEHVASLTLASPMLSGADWQRHVRDLIATLSDSSQRAIVTRDSVQDYDAMDYQSAAEEFYGRYVSLHPAEAERDSMAHTLNGAIHAYMWGPNEFTLLGQLKTYDGKRLLRRLRTPSLYTVGEFDVAGPDLVKRLAAATPKSRYEVIPGAAHFMMWDNPDAFVGVVRDFLRSVETPPAPPTSP
jgi:proline iminopeptidase